EVDAAGLDHHRARHDGGGELHPGPDLQRLRAAAGRGADLYLPHLRAHPDLPLARGPSQQGPRGPGADPARRSDPPRLAAQSLARLASMNLYPPPLDDIGFCLDEFADLPGLMALPEFAELTPDLVTTILEAAGKFAAERLAPLNGSGDRQGSRLENGMVR